MTDRDERADALADRLFDATLGALDLFTVYLGDELGYYEALADADALTAGDLAGRTGTDERYAREWLEQQTVADVLVVEDETHPAADRRYRLPPGHEEALLDRDSLRYAAQQAHLAVGAGQAIDDVAAAYRTGEGVPFDAYGPLREGQARTNRAELRRRLGREWLPVMTDVHDRLQSGDARVADVGCGAGWAAVAVAEAYPRVAVDGFDLDRPSVERARDGVTRLGLDDRVTVHHRDAAALDREDAYDLAMAVEVVHDLADPVGALRAMRRLVREDGAVLVVDQRVADAFTADAGPVEQLIYGWSSVHCLPVGRADDPSAATGAVMRTDTLRAYADEAGFAGVTVLPIDHDGFRFFRLDP